MNILHISDSHNRHQELELTSADVLVFSGDESNSRNVGQNKKEFLDFFQWFCSLDYKHKIFVPGNHSTFIESNEKLVREMFEVNGIHLLINQSVIIDGVKFYGTPVTERFFYWAYNVDKLLISKYWDMIPKDTNVLITHSPPYWILDRVRPSRFNVTCHAGSESLAMTIRELKELKLHCFGHIHDCPELGIRNKNTYVSDNIIYSNASALYDPLNFNSNEETDLNKFGNMITI